MLLKKLLLIKVDRFKFILIVIRRTANEKIIFKTGKKITRELK